MQEGGIVKPVSAQELRFAMAIFENAALMKTPRPNVQTHAAMIIHEDGSVYRLADHKLTRGLTAIIDHYKEQQAAAEDRHAIEWRILCLPDIARHPSCAKLDDAVIETLAIFPMRYAEDIAIDDFFRQVEDVANKKASSPVNRQSWASG